MSEVDVYALGGYVGLGGDRAKLTGVSVEPPAGSDQTIWFNGAAFTAADAGTWGNVPKGAYYGPSLQTWDMGLFKNFRMSTSMNVQFRAEFFNIFNMVNFGLPGTSANNTASLGRITGVDGDLGDPRIIQFGLKFVF